MSTILNVSRRDFLNTLGLGAGAFVLGANIPGLNLAEAATKSGASTAAQALGYFVSISKNGMVDIICHRSEMGQGIITSVPQIIADEMGADWSKVTATQAKADAKYGNQGTGGSASIRSFFPHIRQMGAVARDMLEQAAANVWKVKKSEVKVSNHSVVHTKSGKKLGFGELAELAANLPMPNPKTVTLKPTSDFSLIGKDVKLIGQEDIVQGKMQYAQDVQLPGMLIASIERPPVVSSVVKSFDATEAKKVAGVVDVIQLKDPSMPLNVKPVSGVAVLATNTWAALEGRKKLKIKWDLGGNASHNVNHNTDSYKKELVEKVNRKGIVARSDGDVYSHKYNEEQVVEATYTVPYHHHMPMETPAATAVFNGDKCTIWTGTQNPQWGKTLVLEFLGLDPKVDGDKVDFNLTMMGGAFGRKSKNDFTLEAVELAKATGKPVKVVWSREDDVKHGFYHAIAANYYKAELNKDNKADFWVQRVVHPQIGWIFDANSDQPSNGNLAQSFADIPFDLNNISCETQKIGTHVRCGWLRSVHNISNAFAMGSFVDELAVKAKISTRQMWMNLLGKDRLLDFNKEGFENWNNYGHSEPEYALDTARMKTVINTLTDKAGVDETLPKNEGWGISYATSFNSYAAAATKVRVVDGKVEILEMHTAIDCGVIITPDRVKSQMEGAMIMGISTALYGEITVKDGAIEQGNFHDYIVARMNQVPPLHVHLVNSGKAPGGVGEPGLPPIMPSITNAIYHASGVRVRDLPVSKVLKV